MGFPNLLQQTNCPSDKTFNFASLKIIIKSEKSNYLSLKQVLNCPDNYQKHWKLSKVEASVSFIFLIKLLIHVPTARESNNLTRRIRNFFFDLSCLILFIYNLQLWRNHANRKRMMKDWYIYYNEICQSNIGQSIRINQRSIICNETAVGLHNI